MTAKARFALALIAAALAAPAAKAATFGDLSGANGPIGGAGAYAAGPYAANPYGAAPYATAAFAPCSCPPQPMVAPAYPPLNAFGPPGGYGAPGPYAPPYGGGPAPLGGYGGAPLAGGYGAPGPYAQDYPGGQAPSSGAEGVAPPAFDAPGLAPAPMIGPKAYLPFGSAASLPNGALQAETFEQVNSTTDPYNRLGLSTPFMFVPWSTPLSGWTNAQTWNWWRERSGAPSYGW